MPAKSILASGEVLTRGGDILAKFTDFKLVGRDQELVELFSILMRMKKNNVIITGRGGVGISSVVLGIQSSKKDFSTPLEIVGKRLYWLNTDRLFESGDTRTVNTIFQKVRDTLINARQGVLVVEDTADFLKSTQSHGCTNLINGIMGDIKSGKYQAIFETRDETLGEVLKCDGDISECFTLYELKEPSSEDLRLMLIEATKSLESHHNIKVSKSSLEAAVSLTEKYKLAELRAQPDAAISLLDQSLTDYARKIHSCVEYHKKLGFDEETWIKRQNQIRSLYKDISDGEEEIRKIEDCIEKLRLDQTKRAEQVEGNIERNIQNTRILSEMMSSGNMDTSEISELRGKVSKIEKLVSESKKAFKEKTAEIYANVELDSDSVYSSFSVISGIPVDKLNEDERIRLKNLDQILAARVIGQAEPTTEVAKAVKRSRLGLKMPNKPSGTFLFLGPSGVGKTELAKVLSEALQVPLLRFDMSEYMERHAVAKLIGAPPGYEGYEHGGILTNAVRRNPYSVILFDEIEKAHVDVFNLMLQVLDDARLTDSRGLTASFKDSIIIMTTNVGTPHFLNEEISFEDSKKLALDDLRAQYRPEFLGRFGGNIYCFQRLNFDVLARIARKDLDRINQLISERGLVLEMGDIDLINMLQDKYVAREGARSILGYIDRNITSGIADVVLTDRVTNGKITVTYDKESMNTILSS